MKHSLFIFPLALTLSSLISPQAVNARPQNKSVAEYNTPTTNTTERNKALVLKWSDALRNKDMATAQALVTDDWTIHGTGSNFARGPEGLKQWHGYIDAMWANPHWTEADDIFAEGDKVIRRTTVYRTWRANNKESAMTVVFIYRIADGKIAEVWRVADALTSYQQIGAQIIMPGTNVDAGQAPSLPARPETVTEQKSSSEQKSAQSNKVIGDTNTTQRETPRAGTTESNKALVARWADAIWNKDLAAAQAVVTNDCVIHAANSTYAKGPEGIKQWLAEADSNWSYGGSTTDDVIAEGDKVARRTTVFAMYKPNHRSTVTPVVFIYRVADGKIAEVWRVANYVSTYLQAGARIIMPGETERSVKKTEAEQDVLKAKQEFDEAALHNDADGRARFYADDYAVVYYDGTMGDKAKQLERVRSGRLRYFARTAEDVVVRVYGDTALIVVRRKQTATFDGQPRPSDVRASEVWVKREGKWRLVSTQITPVLEPISGPLLQGEAARQPPEPSKSANEPIGTETAPEIAGGTSQAQQEILKALQEASEATPRNDADALARILSDDSLVVIYNGALQWGKDSQVESLRSGYMKFSAATVQDVSVRLYGDSAVVIKRRKQVASVAGRGRPGDVRMTNLWVKRQDRWQEVFVQVTPILEPPPAPTGTGNASAPSQTRTTTDDEAAIRKIVADGTDAWNRRDAKALAAHIREDGDHINVNGAWRNGRAETEKALSAALATTRNNVSSSVAKIRFVTPDVAVVIVRREYTNDKETRKAISTNVFQKIDGTWWNEAFQNTYVVPPESRTEVVTQTPSENPIAHVKHVRANGVELAYVEKGEGEPIILVHGLISDYRTWDKQMDEFAKHFHVIAYSRRYHYPNSWTGDASDYTVDLHVRDLAALIKVLNLGPVHLVGHSYGGRVATLVAIAHPELVRSLVVAETGFASLLKPKPEWQQTAENQKKVYEAVSEATRSGGAEAGVKMLFEFGGKTGAFDQLPAEQRQRYLDNARTLVPAWREQVQSTSNFACADASQIKAPVLWIESDSASRTTRLVGEEFARCKPQLERVTIPHSEHGMMHDNAAAFNQAVLAFLPKAPAPTTNFVEPRVETPPDPERTSSGRRD